MASPDISLLAKRRFAPMFVVQFLGAFNDNVVRYAMLALATYGLGRASPIRPEVLASVALGLFILPYLLLSAWAGQVADAIDKARLVRFVKLAEIGIMAVALVGFWLSSIWLLLAALFLMGVHSTIFGPVKYSILPQHLATNEMMGGTGLIEAGTFVAILGGQLLGNAVPPREAGLIAMACAGLGLAAAFAVPSAPPSGVGHRIDWNIWRGTIDVLRTVARGRGTWLAILGISWFFAVGGVVSAEVPALVAGQMGGSRHVVLLFLIVFSLSIAIGSVGVNRLLRGEVSARYVPAAGVVMGLSMIDLGFATWRFVATPGQAGVGQFLAAAGSWHVLAGLVGTAVGGGMFVVPLYAVLSTFTPPAERSRVLAGNNIVNSVVTVLVVGGSLWLFGIGASVPGVIAALGLATLPVAGLAWRFLPQTHAPAGS
jgi:acyl-[acyl-carrier-protein]-phospholipid O-acyltransferase/long-chain-fatty-acid--[acyl-carrier-protein] ligase